MTFRHNYDLEQANAITAFDCGVLEISINGGAFTDIITAGGSFVTGGYNHTGIDETSLNPCLPNRPNWSGVSGGFTTTTVNLPAAGIGKQVKLRWRMCSDDSVSHTGWRVDNVVSAVRCLLHGRHATPTPRNTPTPTIQVTVQTSPAGRTFTVDGTTYAAAQTFSWAPGSSHTIATTSPQSGATGVRYVWSNWSGGGTISHTVAPTKNTTYTATFTTQYYLTMSAGSGGTVSPGSSWKNSGAIVSISATPATGHSFSSWTGSGTGSYSGTNNPASITISGPITETAAFTP